MKVPKTLIEGEDVLKFQDEVVRAQSQKLSEWVFPRVEQEISKRLQIPDDDLAIQLHAIVVLHNLINTVGTFPHLFHNPGFPETMQAFRDAYQTWCNQYLTELTEEQAAERKEHEEN